MVVAMCRSMLSATLVIYAVLLLLALFSVIPFALLLQQLGIARVIALGVLGIVALGVAMGAFGLAAAATIHALTTGNYRVAYLFALVAWPAITALPAFLVALGAGTMVAKVREKRLKAKG